MQITGMGKCMLVVGAAAGLMVLRGMALPQAGAGGRSLVIEGQSGEEPVVRMRGKTYVEVDALARLMHGSVSSQGNTMTLTIPGFPPRTATTIGGEKSEFSKEYLRAAVEEMASLRQWRVAVTNAVQNGQPVGDDWVAVYRDPAVRNLGLAQVAATTQGDRNAYQLLSNEFNNMKTLSAQLVAAHTAQNYTPPNTLQSDPLNQKILSCEHALTAMATSGKYADDASCH
ncbi:MAG: hypothetical protein ACRD51_17830 [Candidatus Acidiferrum sp.]